MHGLHLYVEIIIRPVIPIVKGDPFFVFVSMCNQHWYRVIYGYKDRPYGQSESIRGLSKQKQPKGALYVSLSVPKWICLREEVNSGFKAIFIGKEGLSWWRKQGLEKFEMITE